MPLSVYCCSSVRAIFIARLSSLFLTSWAALCKNFYVAYYVLKMSTSNLEYLLIMTSCSCKTRCITLKGIVWSYALFYLKILSRMMATDRQVLVLHTVLLLSMILFRSLSHCAVGISCLAQ